MDKQTVQEAQPITFSRVSERPRAKEGPEEVKIIGAFCLFGVQRIISG